MRVPRQRDSSPRALPPDGRVAPPRSGRGAAPASRRRSRKPGGVVAHQVSVPGVLSGEVSRYSSAGRRTWPTEETAGRWMKYSSGRPTTGSCVGETSAHHGHGRAPSGPAMLDRVSQLMGEPAILFKEKINFKLSGGSGFAAHQDAPP